MAKTPTAAQIREFAAVLGRLGGSKTSERKTLAARANAKKPRPKARKSAA